MWAKKLDRLAILGGIVLLYSTAMVLAATFLRIYFSPGQYMILSINTFGEANLEFVLMFLLVGLGIYAFSRTMIILFFRRNNR